MGPGDERARLHATRLGGAHHAREGQELFSSLHAIPAKPASGRSHDSVTLGRNRDYPADSDLCFGTGNSVTRVRLTPADIVSVIAALAPSMPTPGDLVAAFLTDLGSRTEAGSLYEADQQAVERVIALLEAM